MSHKTKWVFGFIDTGQNTNLPSYTEYSMLYFVKQLTILLVMGVS